MKKTAKKRRGSVDRSETFDEFLARDGLLAETESGTGVTKPDLVPPRKPSPYLNGFSIRLGQSDPGGRSGTGQ